MSVSYFVRPHTRLLAAFGVALAVSAVAPHTAHAQTTITSLFNTGVDNSGVLLPGGAADTHYTMTANNVGLTNGISALVNTNQQFGTYISNPTSKYLSPDGVDGSTPSSGNYALTYRTTFTLPANVVLSSVNIAGSIAVDNSLSAVLINGQNIGTTIPFSNSAFSTFTTFTVPPGFFQAGTNTLDYQWVNSGGSGGLNVFYSTKSFQTSGSAVAPEPGSVVLLLTAGLPVAGLLVHRRKVNRGV